ncbi:MAG: IPT/TIG domain-containing protein [Candidatus Binataceae bacterium]|nr:IPT/TIG domain-containing protein [Candidatus Binataceae bacterium]
MFRNVAFVRNANEPTLPRLRILALAVFFLLIVAAPTEAGNVSYVYDNGDRLLAAYDGNGNVANYQYDQVGNITAIVKSSASAVAVFGYSPDHNTGGQVTIFGNNFSTTSSQNTVTVGSIQATVLSSTQTQIVVSAPSSSGPITVTTPSGSATGPGFN